MASLPKCNLNVVDCLKLYDADVRQSCCPRENISTLELEVGSLRDVAKDVEAEVTEQEANPGMVRRNEVSGWMDRVRDLGVEMDKLLNDDDDSSAGFCSCCFCGPKYKLGKQAAKMLDRARLLKAEHEKWNKVYVGRRLTEPSTVVLRKEMMELRAARRDMVLKVEVAEKKQFMRRTNLVAIWFRRVESLSRKVDENLGEREAADLLAQVRSLSVKGIELAGHELVMKVPERLDVPFNPPSGPSSPPPGSGGGGSVELIITRELFEEMLKHRNDPNIWARGFYTYEAFIEAAEAFPRFGTTGDEAIRKRELAAFFAQTSQQTTGGWETAPDGRCAWGYCFKEQIGQHLDSYSVRSSQWPAASGKKYYGRGPIMLSYNYNYGAAGRAIGEDLLGNPDLVAADPVVAFKTAIWFWMTPQFPKPSCHEVLTGRWTPAPADVDGGRVPGFGVTTVIITGAVEEEGDTSFRVGFFRRYCDMLGVSCGDNLDCAGMRPFA